VTFKNFHNSLNSLTTVSVHNSLLHLLSNFQNTITPRNIADCNNALFNALYFHNERAEQL